MMTFTQYRAAALKIFWPQATEFLGMSEREIVKHENFSTWKVDNICATYWKYSDPIRFCVAGLLDYIKKI